MIALDYQEVLRKSGHYVASDALQSVQTATTIRIRNGKAFTTDGPFAETKEQLLVRQTADHKEGVQAFKDKRPPKFTGR